MTAAKNNKATSGVPAGTVRDAKVCIGATLDGMRPARARESARIGAVYSEV